MRKLILRILPIIFPVIVLILILNYSVDPANLFNKEYAKRIAINLNNGYNIANVGNYDERELQKEWINGYKQTPDIIILGSSRSMLINSTLFENQVVKNNSVSGASLEDYLAIYNCYSEKGMMPKRIIINVDPYLLNANNNQFRWKSIARDYYKLLNQLYLGEFFQESELVKTELRYRYDKFYEFISFEYFQQSVIDLVMTGRKNQHSPTHKMKNDKLTKNTDGSIKYDFKTLNRDTNEVNKMAYKQFNSGSIYSLGEFSELNEAYCQIFQTFIAHLKSKKIDITFFYSPYHPLVYSQLKSDRKYELFFKAENFYNELANKYEIHIKGTFSPFELNLKSKDFYDGLHCNQTTIDRLLDN